MTAPVHQPWPERKLEHLGHCPVCGSEQKTVLLDELVDDSFGVAPGIWTLWRCESCTNAYLDPRPNRSSIGEAYASYYTHEAEPRGGHPVGRLARLRHALGNGYRNKRFGAGLTPALVAGYLITRLLPAMRTRIDASYRFLPRAADGRRALLDIGCGNGEWLELAKKAGWTADGVEPDPISARKAKDRGIDVRGDLNDFIHERKFDQITMHHVIEHVHDPVDTVNTCFRLLSPGGQLYIETPNIDALGRTIYGRSWRGLESPRHLVLFTVPGLVRMLEDAGFSDVRLHPQLHVWKGMSIASERIRKGALPEDSSVDADPSRYGLRNRVRTRFDPSKAEFITLTCRRPA